MDLALLYRKANIDPLFYFDTKKIQDYFLCQKSTLMVGNILFKIIVMGTCGPICCQPK